MQDGRSALSKHFVNSAHVNEYIRINSSSTGLTFGLNFATGTTLVLMLLDRWRLGLLRRSSMAGSKEHVGETVTKDRACGN